jgi:hypothetical protein
MDADFSHDPADLPRLIGPARAGADLVIGSRYVAGGGIENWTLPRRLVSRAGCAYARTVLRVPVRDLTSGFKCFRAEALEALDFGSVRSLGYGFQIELTWRALRSGRRVVEVPIVFHERREGTVEDDGTDRAGGGLARAATAMAVTARDPIGPAAPPPRRRGPFGLDRVELGALVVLSGSRSSSSPRCCPRAGPCRARTACSPPISSSTSRGSARPPTTG